VTLPPPSPPRPQAGCGSGGCGRRDAERHRVPTSNTRRAAAEQDAAEDRRLAASHGPPRLSPPPRGSPRAAGDVPAELTRSKATGEPPNNRDSGAKVPCRCSLAGGRPGPAEVPCMCRGRVQPGSPPTRRKRRRGTEAPPRRRPRSLPPARVNASRRRCAPASTEASASFPDFDRPLIGDSVISALSQPSTWNGFRSRNAYTSRAESRDRRTVVTSHPARSPSASSGARRRPVRRQRRRFPYYHVGRVRSHPRVRA
jgi:hypothetical protein